MYFWKISYWLLNNINNLSISVSFFNIIANLEDIKLYAFGVIKWRPISHFWVKYPF